MSSRSVLKVSEVHIVPAGVPSPSGAGRNSSPVSPFTTSSGRMSVPIGVSFSTAPVIPTTTTRSTCTASSRRGGAGRRELGAHAGDDGDDAAGRPIVVAGAHRRRRPRRRLLQPELPGQGLELHGHGADEGDVASAAGVGSWPQPAPSTPCGRQQAHRAPCRAQCQSVQERQDQSGLPQVVGDHDPEVGAPERAGRTGSRRSWRPTTRTARRPPRRARCPSPARWRASPRSPPCTAPPGRRARDSRPSAPRMRRRQRRHDAPPRRRPRRRRRRRRGRASRSRRRSRGGRRGRRPARPRTGRCGSMSKTSPTSEHASAATNQTRRVAGVVRRRQRHARGDERHQRRRLAQVLEPGVLARPRHPVTHGEESRATRRPRRPRWSPSSPPRPVPPSRRRRPPDGTELLRPSTAMAAFSRCHTSVIRSANPSRSRALFATKRLDVMCRQGPRHGQGLCEGLPGRRARQGEPGGDGVARRSAPSPTASTTTPAAGRRVRGRSQLLPASAQVPRDTKGMRISAFSSTIDEIAVQEQGGAEPHGQPVDRGHKRLREAGQAVEKRIEVDTELGAAAGAAHLVEVDARRERPPPPRQHAHRDGGVRARRRRAAP